MTKILKFKIIERYFPAIFGAMISSSLAVFWKFLALGGPIISDEWSYFHPVKELAKNNEIISYVGGILYSYTVLLTTTSGPLSKQYGYVFFNIILIFGIYLMLNEYLIKLRFATRLLVFTILGFSGFSLYGATLMPEIITVFLTILGLFLLLKMQKYPRSVLVGLILLITIMPFVKIHLILVSLSLLTQLCVFVWRNNRGHFYTYISTCLFSIFILLGLANYFAKGRNSYSYYLSARDGFQFSYTDIFTFAFLFFGAVCLILIFSGHALFSMCQSRQFLNIEVFLVTLSLLSLLFFTYFSVSVKSLGIFEANRLHGRYFLPLIFVLLPTAIKQLYASKSFGLIWIRFLLFGCFSIYALSTKLVNFYPWDDPFYVGISSGKTPYGWTMGGPSPILVMVGIALFSYFACLMMGHDRTKGLIASIFIGLSLSSSVVTTQWIYINRVTAPGESILWAINHAGESCYPVKYPGFTVEANVVQKIIPCSDR
jgi:hypothetical protein